MARCAIVLNPSGGTFSDERGGRLLVCSSAHPAAKSGGVSVSTPSDHADTAFTLPENQHALADRFCALLFDRRDAMEEGRMAGAIVLQKTPPLP
jgi:hypothetical protein